MAVADNRVHAATRVHAADVRAEHEADAIPLEGPLDDGRSVRILALEQARLIVEQDDLDPETLKCLGELASDRPAPNHRQPARGIGQGEDRLAGQRRGVGQPRDGRDGRPATGCDDRAGEAQPLVGHENRFPVDEPRVAEEHVHAEVLEPARRVMRGNGRPRSSHACHRLGEWQMCAGAADESLGGDTPGVKAIAPEKVALHEGDAGAKPRGPGRRDEPGGAAANHHEVVSTRWNRIDPVRGAHLRSPLLVGGVRHLRQADSRCILNLPLAGTCGGRLGSLTFQPTRRSTPFREVT